MNTRLDTARARVGPLVLGVGMAMLAVAFVGYGADHRHPRAAAPASPPSVTSSSPPAATKHAKYTRSAAGPNPGRESAGGRVLAAASKHSTGGGTTPRRPSTIAPSGPKPSPPAAPPPVTTSCALGVTVLVLNACLNIGDAR